jgi:hypothetical protein
LKVAARIGSRQGPHPSAFRLRVRIRVIGVGVGEWLAGNPIGPVGPPGKVL